MIDLKKLENGLKNLNGYDFESAEKKVVMAHGPQFSITATSFFQAELAAKALSISVEDLKKENISDYAVACQTVYNFLLLPLAEQTLQQSSTEEFA